MDTIEEPAVSTKSSPEKRKTETEEYDVSAAPAISKKRKKDVAWVKEGMESSDPFETVKKLVVAIMAFKAKESSASDIIKDYLQNDGNGLEFLPLLDGSSRKGSQIALVFTIFETMFQRIANDLTEYREIGMALASALLKSHMDVVYMTMSANKKSVQVKSTLRMLTSMVTLSHLTAREVIVRVDFTNENVQHASQRKKFDEKPDVRTTYVMFITSFLMEEDTMLLRTLAENATILWSVFFHLHSDTIGTVQLFLTALRDKLVMSTLLSKTLKLYTFNGQNLVQLMRLFSWVGPQDPRKKTKKIDEPLVNEEFEEDRVAVAQLIQSFLLSLTTSHKYGVAFADYSLGKELYCKNGLIFQMLQDLFKFWQGTAPRIVEIQSQLVIKTIEKCPDLMERYIKTVSGDLDDMRDSVSWLNLASLVQGIIDVQNLVVVFNPKEKYSVGQQVNRAVTLIGPFSLSRKFFDTGLTKPNPVIWLAVGKIFQSVLAKINEFKTILFQNPKADMYSLTEKEELFKALKRKLFTASPASSKLVEICSKIPSFKEKGSCIEYWIVMLDILANYAKLEWIESEEDTRTLVSKVVTSIMDCENDEAADKKQIEKLKLSVFTFIASLSKFPKLPDDQLKTLVSQLTKCLVATELLELRLCVGSLLVKMTRWDDSLPMRLSDCEFNTWIGALERHSDDAFSFFTQAFSTWLISPTAHQMTFETVFDSSQNAVKSQESESVCSPLLLTVWKCFKESNEQIESVGSYITAVTCELILSQNGLWEFFTNLEKNRLPDVFKSRPLLVKFFKSLSPGKKKPMDTSNLKLSPAASILYACNFPVVSDWSSLKSNWNEAIVSVQNRSDLQDVILSQIVNSLWIASTRKVDHSKILDLLRALLDVETNETGYRLHEKLLENSRVIVWFDLMNDIDPFIKDFNVLVQNSLKLVHKESLNRTYQRKFNDTTAIAIEKGTLANLSEEDLLIFISSLKIQDVEPRIISLTERIKSTSDEISLRYLNVYLQHAGRLRLEGAIQRLSWSAFSRALRLYISLGAPIAMGKGIYNIVSVCLEFLDSTDDFTEVLRACLDSSSDYTKFCLLLVTSSSQLCAAFGQWCLQNEQHFNNVNWRLQILPDYLASAKHDVKVLDMLHASISPVFKKLLTSRSDYREVTARVNKLPEFLHVLISERWSAEECRDLASKLLSEYKKGLSCAQFVEAGRRGVHHDLHAKLCLRATVRQFKSENPEPTEIKQLAHEFVWLSKQNQLDVPSLVESILQDTTWSKFLKYTLRVGLRALTADQSTLPPLALQVMTNLWRLLLTDPSDDIKATSKKVYEMITSHSEFITVIMDERGIYVEQKIALLQLMTVLIQVNPKLCQGSQVPLLLTSYYATRSASDQLIFGLLRFYEENGVVLSTYKPYLWGQTAAAHYSIQRGAGSRQTQTPQAAEVITLLNSQTLLQTAYHFPMEMKLNGTETVTESEDYDPRFILMSLAHILSKEYFVECGKFTQSGAVSLIFASLSSPCSEMRSLGWLCLSRLYVQLENAESWPERCLWIHLIGCVRNGADEFFNKRFGASLKAPAKISNIIALFLAKASAIIRDPVHPMYRAINNFLLVKPAMDVNQVPEFFVMLHSNELADQRTLYRTFLLHLLRDGIKSRQDYLVCARRRVFRILLSLQPSDLLTDYSDKNNILEIVQSSLQNSMITYDLIQHRGLLMWLDSLLLRDTFTGKIEHVLSVVETLWNTLYTHMQAKRISKEKSDEEALAKLESEVKSVEAEDEDHTTADIEKTVDPAAKKPVTKLHCRKPIWDLLPTQQQVISPWIMVELIQILTNLWRRLYEVELDYTNFDKYTRVLCEAASHIHESKNLIRLAQKMNPKTVRFVAPPKMMSLKLMRQLVEVSTRFVSDLPDLKDHLAAVETSKTRLFGDPGKISQTWMRSHTHMSHLMGKEEQNLSTRCNLHLLLSLAECGV